MLILLYDTHMIRIIQITTVPSYNVLILNLQADAKLRALCLRDLTMKSPSPSPAPTDPSQSTPKTGKRGTKRILMTPGTPDPGNGTLLGVPGILDFILCCLPDVPNLSVPKAKRHLEHVLTEPGQLAASVK